MFRSVLAAALAFAAPLAPAGAAYSAAAESAQLSAEALQLARLMAPKALMVEAELRQFDLHFRPTLLKDEGIKSLEADYPGIVEAMAKATRPLLSVYTANQVETAHARQARVLQDDLSSEEIAELTQFYSSPAGQSVLRQIVMAVDASETYAAGLEGQEQVGRETIEAQNWMASMKAVGSMSPADYQALMDFGKRPVAGKLNALRAKMLKITVDAMTEPDPEYDAQLEAVMEQAIQEHMDKASASSAE